MPHSSYTHTDSPSRMLSQEHHSLLLQSWQSSEKSSLLVSLHDFYMINNLTLVVISTVFGTPTDLSHIFCHTSVNIYCGDSAFRSAACHCKSALPLPLDRREWPLDLEVQEGEVEGGICMLCVYCVCVCVCLWVVAEEFPSRATRPVILPTQSLCQALSCHILLPHPQPKSLKQTLHTKNMTTTILWLVTEGGDEKDRETKRGIWGSVMDGMKGC